MKNLHIFFFSILIQGNLLGQVSTGPSIVSQYCFGGSRNDHFRDCTKLSNGNFISTIYTASSDGDLEGVETPNGWVICFDENLVPLWQKFFSTIDCPTAQLSVKELNSGNLLFSGTGGYSCEGYQGGIDLNILLTDSEGNELWSKCYGSPGSETFHGFLATEDGGYLLTGSSNSSGGDIPFHYGSGFTYDAIVIKIDSLGIIEWTKVLGGSDNDAVVGDILEITENQYVVEIGSYSNDFDLAESEIEGAKFWILEIDSTGTITKENIIDGDENLIQIRSSGFEEDKILLTGIGNSASINYPAPAGHSGYEGAILEIDQATFEIITMHQYGGSLNDVLVNYVRTESGYYFLGYSASSDYDLPGNYNEGEEQEDYWLLSTDENFNMLWSKNFGGSFEYGELNGGSFHGNLVLQDNLLYAFIQCMVPETLPDYDIECGHASTVPGYQYSDAWVVAFDLTTGIEETEKKEQLFSLYPNPADKTVTILFSEKIKESKTVQLINISGNVNEYYVIEKNIDSIEVDVRNFPKGLYIVKINTGKKEGNTKLFIE